MNTFAPRSFVSMTAVASAICSRVIAPVAGFTHVWRTVMAQVPANVSCASASASIGLIYQSWRFRAACQDYRLAQEFITPVRRIVERDH
jgi:hypothetical protein